MSDKYSSSEFDFEEYVKERTPIHISNWASLEELSTILQLLESCVSRNRFAPSNSDISNSLGLARLMRYFLPSNLTSFPTYAYSSDKIAPLTELCEGELKTIFDIIGLYGEKMEENDQLPNLACSLKRLRRALKLIKDIINTDHARFLAQEQLRSKGQANKLAISISKLKDFAEAAVQRNYSTQRDLEALRDGLRELDSLAERSERRYPGPSALDFEFCIPKTQLNMDLPEDYKVKGFLDTGSKRNWVSRDVLLKAGLADSIQLLDSTEQVPFNCSGGQIHPLGLVQMEIWEANAKRGRRGIFLVANNPPFDLVLGMSFWKAHAVRFFSKPKLKSLKSIFDQSLDSDPYDYLIAEERGEDLDTVEDLHQWSVKQVREELKSERSEALQGDITLAMGTVTI
ncbi:hypothetical protein ABW19_dt0206350 [Dactylella cylindrospora]|nr:hypothetical protein ABW19_dt0206350 [Dactylella cylindrospora]